MSRMPLRWGLAILAVLATTRFAAAQSGEPFTLEIGDPARKARTIALAVDQIHDTHKGVDVSPDEVADLHHRSHEECFIANSVRTEVVVRGLPVHA